MRDEAAASATSAIAAPRRPASSARVIARVPVSAQCECECECARERKCHVCSSMLSPWPLSSPLEEREPARNLDPRSPRYTQAQKMYQVKRTLTGYDYDYIWPAHMRRLCALRLLAVLRRLRSRAPPEDYDFYFLILFSGNRQIPGLATGAVGHSLFYSRR